MPKTRNILIVIADGEHVRFVRPAEDNALHSESTISSHQADFGGDHAGSSPHARSSAHHTLDKEKFAHAIAQQLNAGAAAGAFEELVIVAPSHILSAIRDALDTTTEPMIIGTLAKDLVKTPDSDLWPHVREWVRPVHRQMTTGH